MTYRLVEPRALSYLAQMWSRGPREASSPGREEEGIWG
jgi:hypothetical protein